MLRVQTILFPTDFTEHAEGAFAHAAHLARQYGAAIHVLNVVAPHKPEANNPLNVLPLEQEEDGELYHLRVDEQEGTVTGESHAEGDLHVHYQQVRRASPVVAILEYADAHDTDLIVMGTRGRDGLDRLLTGSVAEEVVRLAGCPTLTVRAEDEGTPAGVDRVLVPIDLSEQAAPQLAHAAALAEAYNARLDLLHVIEVGAFPAAYGLDTQGLLPAGTEVNARKALRELARRFIPDALRPDRRPVEMHAFVGHAAYGIVTFAEEHDADLVVMATHGRTGLQRFLLGSVAEKVVRQAPCPVFTVRSFGRQLAAPHAALDENAD